MSDTAYRPSDLRERSREILDLAKSGEARVRDSDGTTILMLPESDVLSLRRVNAAAANLAAVERIVGVMEARRLDAAEFGEWGWLYVFDADDLREFVQDIREAIIGARDDSGALLDEQLTAWRTTASQADDQVIRAILRGGASEEAFVEINRPGAEVQPDGVTVEDGAECWSTDSTSDCGVSFPSGLVSSRHDSSTTTSPRLPVKRRPWGPRRS